MFSVHERWTTYDERDGINGSASRLVAVYQSIEDAILARDVLIEEIGPAFGEVDAVVLDETGREIYYASVEEYHRKQAERANYRPIDPNEIPF